MWNTGDFQQISRSGDFHLSCRYLSNKRRVFVAAQRWSQFQPLISATRGARNKWKTCSKFDRTSTHAMAHYNMRKWRQQMEWAANVYRTFSCSALKLVYSRSKSTVKIRAWHCDSTAELDYGSGFFWCAIHLSIHARLKRQCKQFIDRGHLSASCLVCLRLPANTRSARLQRALL